MATVTDMLGDLHAGRATLARTADLFRAHRWVVPARADDDIAAMWGQDDGELPGPDTWGAVDADSRLTAEQYEVLAQAYEDAVGGAP